MSADQPSDIVSRRPLSAREIALQLRSRWWLLLGLFALFASGAIVAASRYQPKYAATSSVTLRRPLEKRSIRSVHVEMRDLDQTPTGLADTLRQALLEPQALAAFFDANPLTFPAAEKERVRLTKLLERSMKFRPVSSVLFVIAVTAPSPISRECWHSGLPSARYAPIFRASNDNQPRYLSSPSKKQSAPPSG